MKDESFAIPVLLAVMNQKEAGGHSGCEGLRAYFHLTSSTAKAGGKMREEMK